MLIGETWLSPVIPNSVIDLNDYDLYRTDHSSRGGGASIFLRKAVFMKFTVATFNKNCGNSEFICVNCVNNTQQFSLSCAYRPRSSTLADDQLLFDQIKSVAR